MQLTGDLSKVSLPNLLQLVRNGELTGKFSLLAGTKSAMIYMDRGQIIHVESDVGNGREGLMELFLWSAGSFSFIEEDVTGVAPTLVPSQNQADTLERLVREGIGYLEQRKYLEQMQVSGQTILVPTEAALHPQTWQPPVRAALFPLVEPILTRIDGRKTLAEALADVTMSRRGFIAGVYHLLAGGFALIREPELGADSAGERVNLPPWVVARLQQDNPDLSQAIVDMVIWVDRVKCWMYQVDADFTRIIEEVEMEEQVENPEEDFFTELERGNVSMDEPLFGESMIPSTTPNEPAVTSPVKTDPAITPVRSQRELRRGAGSKTPPV